MEILLSQIMGDGTLISSAAPFCDLGAHEGVFFHRIIPLCSFPADAVDWRKAERVPGRARGFEVHWVSLLIYTGSVCVPWHHHYLFNSTHVLHIKQLQNTWTCMQGIWKCKLAVKLRICSLIQGDIALWCKRSYAHAGDYLAVSALSHFLQQHSSAY